MRKCLPVWPDGTDNGTLKSKGNYGYSEATWQSKTDGVTHSDGVADMYRHSAVKTADGGELPYRLTEERICRNEEGEPFCFMVTVG